MPRENPIGSIPAHAGKPAITAREVARLGVYPRPCGETVWRPIEHVLHQGLSPPMRGNHFSNESLYIVTRSIPAHAGKPPRRSGQARRGRVYPRPCGETNIQRDVPIGGGGLSPPMRGNRRATAPGRWWRRSIPAHAGKPAARSWPAPGARVYPRPCGETRILPRGHLRPRGSIPAHAGKPAGLDRQWRLDRVYPRPCGETLESALQRRVDEGLSPPMRGNPLRRGKPRKDIGSIPAHAGKPASSRTRSCTARVYPRPCGETVCRGVGKPYPTGLSPPMRGNLPGL